MEKIKKNKNTQQTNTFTNPTKTQNPNQPQLMSTTQHPPITNTKPNSTTHKTYAKAASTTEINTNCNLSSLIKKLIPNTEVIITIINIVKTILPKNDIINNLIETITNIIKHE